MGSKLVWIFVSIVHATTHDVNMMVPMNRRPRANFVGVVSEKFVTA